MMKIVIMGLAAMAFVWAVQAQAAEETRQKDIKPIFDKRCLGCCGKESPDQT